jgi:hypothetical protein
VQPGQFSSHRDTEQAPAPVLPPRAHQGRPR